MLTAAQSLVLGAVQGITEFLPVSSSGHLILARAVLGINTESGLAFDAILQLGTILAAFLYFRKDVWRLMVNAWKIVTKGAKSVDATERILLYAIIVGTIPAGIAGLLLQKTMETDFRSPLIVAVMLLVGSALFVYAEKKSHQTHANPTVKDGWIVGAYQCLALVPGMSRSGSTISGGLLSGLSRESAIRFSFLLSLPIIAASGLLELVKVIHSGPTDFTLTTLAIGFVTSFILGYIVISWLLKYLKTHSLMAFVWYRCALAVVVLMIVAFWH
ncbi:MAG: undecaprenyl-diphosphatase UppP [Patescibacteria group bacterium]